MRRVITIFDIEKTSKGYKVTVASTMEELDVKPDVLKSILRRQGYTEICDLVNYTGTFVIDNNQIKG